MLFKETLDRLRPEVESAVTELFALVHRNQLHPQDVLLAQIGTYHGSGFAGFKPFGPGLGGWEHEAEHTQYEFYDLYRRQYQSIARVDFYTNAKDNSEQLKSVRLSVQLELMIYLRFWETDRLLRKLFHYTQLALGRPFNWQYNIPLEASRQDLIRNDIRNPLRTACPAYYSLLKRMYHTQIRNAAAHSQYYITDHNIGFNNNVEGTYAVLGQKPLDWWEDIFHRVILFYNALLAHERDVNERARRQDQLSVGAGLQVKYTDPNLGKEDLVYWTFNNDRGFWDWAPPHTQSGLFV